MKIFAYISFIAILLLACNSVENNTPKVAAKKEVSEQKKQKGKRIGTIKKSKDNFITDEQKTEPKVKTLEKPEAGKELTFYISKLKDTSYYEKYNHNYKWFTAAEELGKIGAPAIPKLMERIDNANSYERDQIFYALLLASQNENTKKLVGDDYIKVGRTAEARQLDIFTTTAKIWWDKHKDKFNGI